MSDEEIKQAMRAIAAMNGLPLTSERIEHDFATYKSYLAALDTIKRVELPMEAAPLPIVALKRDSRA